MSSGEKRWSDPSLLEVIKNPGSRTCKITIRNPEVTFIGAPGQPDFGQIKVVYLPGEKLIELKSFKRYIRQFRDMVISYERFTHVVFEDLITVYDPYRIRISTKFRPRGGITSQLKIASYGLRMEMGE